MKLFSRPRARLCAHIASLTAVAALGANLSNAATLFTDGFENGTLVKNASKWSRLDRLPKHRRLEQRCGERQLFASVQLCRRSAGRGLLR